MKIRNSLRAQATVEAYEKGYRVNKDGDVISHIGNKRSPQKTAKGRREKKGLTYYYRFTYRMLDGRNTTVCFHQLAAYQKFGSATFEGGTVVRHKDGNSENNRLDNILIGTQTDNAFDQPEEIRVARAKHAASFQRKLTMQQARQLRKDRSAGMDYKGLSAKYGIPKSSVSYIVNGKTYPEPG
jgi:hypothetical protein